MAYPKFISYISLEPPCESVSSSLCLFDQGRSKSRMAPFVGNSLRLIFVLLPAMKLSSKKGEM